MAVRDIRTRYGTIHHSSTCKDNYDNIESSREYLKESGEDRRRDRDVAVTLQRPALKSFKKAEDILGREIKTTGSIRSCELQKQLYASDPNRYANPNTTLHTQGLAIDVSTLDHELTTKTRAALAKCGWKQSRPSDEPWHFSFKLEA